jgi:hypothetical protein
VITTPTLSPNPAPTRPTGRWTLLPLGFGLGLLLGVVARLWMRLIAEDPSFTWAGTLFIVGAFGLFGIGQALSRTARQRGWRRAGVTVARLGGAVLALALFQGAGAIMLPTVLLASLACWRTDWPRTLRAVLALLALPVVGLVTFGIGAEFGWGLRGLAGILGFVAVYAVVIAALQPTVAPLDDGWRLVRRRHPSAAHHPNPIITNPTQEGS